jgi:hypothetical protein
MTGYSRAVFSVRICRQTFDYLFNGRSGYRAQYYRSVDEGAAFNCHQVRALLPAINVIFDQNPKGHPWAIVERSIAGPWSKLWVSGDSVPFKEAPDGEFRPRRWHELGIPIVWLKAPLPREPAIEIKGTWMSNSNDGYVIDPMKADRDQQVNIRGGA